MALYLQKILSFTYQLPNHLIMDTTSEGSSSKTNTPTLSESSDDPNYGLSFSQEEIIHLNLFLNQQKKVAKKSIPLLITLLERLSDYSKQLADDDDSIDLYGYKFNKEKLAKVYTKITSIKGNISATKKYRESKQHRAEKLNTAITTYILSFLPTKPLPPELLNAPSTADIKREVFTSTKLNFFDQDAIRIKLHSSISEFETLISSLKPTMNIAQNESSLSRSDALFFLGTLKKIAESLSSLPNLKLSVISKETQSVQIQKTRNSQENWLKTLQYYCKVIDTYINTSRTIKDLLKPIDDYLLNPDNIRSFEHPEHDLRQTLSSLTHDVFMSSFPTREFKSYLQFFIHLQENFYLAQKTHASDMARYKHNLLTWLNKKECLLTHGEKVSFFIDISSLRSTSNSLLKTLKHEKFTPFFVNNLETISKIKDDKLFLESAISFSRDLYEFNQDIQATST